ncbi:MAG TPA: FAD-dependent oxidoreductase [Thermomicrobiales bacterium]|jgi:sarcosine oxidase subunit beta
MPLPINYQHALPASADLVIIGGGVIGAATAFWAARAGLQAVIIERRAALCTLTTAAATGGFRLQHEDHDDWSLVRESLAVMLNFAEATGQRDYDPAVVQRGYLWLTTEPTAITRQHELVALQHGWGQTDVEWLAGDEVRRRFPFVGARVVGGRFRAGDGTFDQKALAFGLAAASHIPLVTNCAVTGFEQTGGRITGVTTTVGFVATDTVVLAAGPFSGALAATVGLTLPLINSRRQKAILPELPEVPAWAPVTLDDDTGTHWRPALRGAFLLGAIGDPIIESASDNVALDYALALRLLDPSSPYAAARIVPFWEGVWVRGASHWSLQAGHYTLTPDNKPLIGPGDVPGLWLNTGYGGHGVMQGIAGSARLLEMITGAQQAATNPFHPARVFATDAARPL